MESDTSLTASTVSNFLLRFSKTNSPNGCSPRLSPAIRELWEQGARRTRLFSRPAYYSCLTARNQSAPGHSWDLDDQLARSTWSPTRRLRHRSRISLYFGTTKVRLREYCEARLFRSARRRGFRYTSRRAPRAHHEVGDRDRARGDRERAAAPDAAVRRRILVENPTRLYEFSRKRAARCYCSPPPRQSMASTFRGSTRRPARGAYDLPEQKAGRSGPVACYCRYGWRLEASI